MEVEEITKELDNLRAYIERAEKNLYYANEEIRELWDELENKAKIKEKTGIKNIDNFKRELKREGLYSQKLEEFLEDYIHYYNN